MNPWNILFPFHKHMKNFTSSPQAKDMEKHLSKMFSNFQNEQYNESADRNNNPFSDTMETNTSSRTDNTVFETDCDVFVRIKIQDIDQLKTIKVFHTSNKVVIDFSEENERQEYTLPAIVKKKGATAQLKDGILEIKLQKASDLQFSEINITEV